ncbi:hypothetical protein E5288_WYG000094 [Bos mutus]|uniref:Uncharacterized protein n=1 Tax=Bos mutus TaxID=72004 RepID=A0A6B0RDT3_9CETA|nr:hypothetical protein [Bos mutus]
MLQEEKVFSELCQEALWVAGTEALTMPVTLIQASVNKQVSRTQVELGLHGPSGDAEEPVGKAVRVGRREEDIMTSIVGSPVFDYKIMTIIYCLLLFTLRQATALTANPFLTSVECTRGFSSLPHNECGFPVGISKKRMLIQSEKKVTYQKLGNVAFEIKNEIFHSCPGCVYHTSCNFCQSYQPANRLGQVLSRAESPGVKDRIQLKCPGNGF